LSRSRGARTGTRLRENANFLSSPLFSCFPMILCPKSALDAVSSFTVTRRRNKCRRQAREPLFPFPPLSRCCPSFSPVRGSATGVDDLYGAQIDVKAPRRVLCADRAKEVFRALAAGEVPPPLFSSSLPSSLGRAFLGRRPGFVGERRAGLVIAATQDGQFQQK